MVRCFNGSELKINLITSLLGQLILSYHRDILEVIFETFNRTTENKKVISSTAIKLRQDISQKKTRLKLSNIDRGTIVT